MAGFKGRKRGNCHATSKTWGFFFGGSGHGPESSCQILAYKFFPGFNVFCRISSGLISDGEDIFPFACQVPTGRSNLVLNIFL